MQTRIEFAGERASRRFKDTSAPAAWNNTRLPAVLRTKLTSYINFFGGYSGIVPEFAA
jgi:hypothetical protein